jgi:hypothetical protein
MPQQSVAIQEKMRLFEQQQQQQQQQMAISNNRGALNATTVPGLATANNVDELTRVIKYLYINALLYTSNIN